MAHENIWNILLDYHFNWSSEVPEELVLAGPYKVRTNWWTVVLYSYDLLQRYGEIPDHLLPETTAFIIDYHSDSFRQREGTTAEDIARANDLNFRLLDWRTSPENGPQPETGSN